MKSEREIFRASLWRNDLALLHMDELVPPLQANPHVVDLLQEVSKGLLCRRLADGRAHLEKDVLCLFAYLRFLAREQRMDGDHSGPLPQERMSIWAVNFLS